MITTQKQIAKVLRIKESVIEPFYRWLELYMEQYGIEGVKREAAFLAQIAHESGRFYYTEEIASGVRYDTGALAVKLGNTPQADGDGQRYKGRGLIQLTGLDNYKRISAQTGIDFVSNPQWLEEPEYAVMSACWFWDSKKLNALADAGDITGMTRRINGGYNGLAERIDYYNKFLIELGDE